VPAYLLLNAGISSGARFELNPDEKVLLGRDWNCNIVLNDPQSSRVHAEVFHDEDGWWIQDHRSSNGTFVNGQQIDNARLVDGTEIRIGSSNLSFQVSSGPTATTGSVEEEPRTGGTIILDQSMNPRETGQYTLDFLKGQNRGQDFFFLFHLFDDGSLLVHVPTFPVLFVLHHLYLITHQTG
jgi:Nif-specific regulatory protein